MKITAPIDNLFLPVVFFIFIIFFLCDGAVSGSYAIERDLNALGQYKSVVTEDIFDPERGKREEEKEEVAQSDTDAEELGKRFVIYGVILDRSGKHAFIKDTKEKRKQDKGRMHIYRDIKPGDLLDGWRVEDIDASGVRLVLKKTKVFLPVFNAEKKERRATRPVALQTPKPRVFKPPVPVRPVSKVGKSKTSRTSPVKRSPFLRKDRNNIPGSRHNTKSAANKGSDVKSALMDAQGRRSRSGSSGATSPFGTPKITPPSKDITPATSDQPDISNNPFLQLLRNGGR